MMLPAYDKIDITLGKKDHTFDVSYTVSPPEPDVGFFSPIVDIDWITDSKGKFVTSELIYDLICDKILEYLP